jgi:hypothetical protein
MIEGNGPQVPARQPGVEGTPVHPVATDAAWIGHFADGYAPPKPAPSGRGWQRELAEFNEELRSRFALSPGEGRIYGAQVRQAVAAHFGLTRAEIAGGSRDAHYLGPRQIAMYICVRFAGLSQVQTGALFGRDRTTVAHAVNRIASRIAADPAFAKDIDALVAACRRSSHRHPTAARERSP